MILIYDLAVICAFIVMAVKFGKWWLTFIALIFVFFPDWSDED